MHMEKVYFSVESANKCIPHLTKKLRRIHQIKNAVDRVMISSEHFSRTVQATNSDGFQVLLTADIKMQKELHKLLFLFYKTLDDIHSLGCIVKDIDAGLIDFYHKLGERDVFLCWKLGESRVEHCHDIDDGFGGRKKIVRLSSL